MNLVAVPDPDDEPSDDHGTITETAIVFNGYLSSLSIDKRSMQLQPTFLVDPRAPITDRDLRVLRGRTVRITIEPIITAPDGTERPATATEDPVAAAVFDRRFDKMVAGWLTDEDDEDDD